MFVFVLYINGIIQWKKEKKYKRESFRLNERTLDTNLKPHEEIKNNDKGNCTEYINQYYRLLYFGFVTPFCGSNNTKGGGVTEMYGRKVYIILKLIWYYSNLVVKRLRC